MPGPHSRGLGLPGFFAPIIHIANERTGYRNRDGHLDFVSQEREWKSYCKRSLVGEWLDFVELCLGSLAPSLLSPALLNGPYELKARRKKKPTGKTKTTLLYTINQKDKKDRPRLPSPKTHHRLFSLITDIVWRRRFSNSCIQRNAKKRKKTCQKTRQEWSYNRKTLWLGKHNRSAIRITETPSSSYYWGIRGYGLLLIIIP